MSSDSEMEENSSILEEEEEEDQNSSTDKDEDEDVKCKKSKIPFNTPKTDMAAKYDKLQGKSLFLRYPKKLPENVEKSEQLIKLLNDRIINVRRPRQKSIRYCLIDFETTEDRNKALKELEKKDVDGKKLVVSLPRTDDPVFVSKILEKKEQKKAAKKAKLRLKKAAKKSFDGSQKEYTSTVVISNIPRNVTVSDIKELFPSAIDCRLNFPKGADQTPTANVVLPTPKEATLARRNKTLQIGENILKIDFATQHGGGTQKFVAGKKKMGTKQNKNSQGERKRNNKKNPNQIQKKKAMKKVKEKSIPGELEQKNPNQIQKKKAIKKVKEKSIPGELEQKPQKKLLKKNFDKNIKTDNQDKMMESVKSNVGAVAKNIENIKKQKPDSKKKTIKNVNLKAKNKKFEKGKQFKSKNFKIK